MEFNLEGTHGKKCLKDHQKFYAVFLESIINLTTNEDPEAQLRRAIQLHKKRVFQRRSGAAKALRAPAEASQTQEHSSH